MKHVKSKLYTTPLYLCAPIGYKIQIVLKTALQQNNGFM